MTVYGLGTPQNFSTHEIPAPPCGQEPLQSWCEVANRDQRGLEQKYQQLLIRIYETTREQLSQDDYESLSHNLLTISQMMPNYIKGNEDIKKVLGKIFFSNSDLTSLCLVRNFCLKINESIRFQTVIYQTILDIADYQEILDIAQDTLIRGVNVDELEYVGRCFTLVTSMMPSEIKKNDHIKTTVSDINEHLVLLLKNYCSTINHEYQSNGLGLYQDILNSFEQALQLQTTIEELYRLSCSLLLTIEFMPFNLQQTPAIAQSIDTLKQQLIAQYRADFEPLREEVRQVRGKSEVLDLQNKIQIIRSHFPDNLDPALTNEMEKCSSFSNLKYLTRSFVERHTPSPEEEESTRSQERNIYPILSIDGGGSRGIIPATMLVAIERITREPIANSFKLMGGTSTGGILVLGLAKPHRDGSGRPEYRAQDLLDLYTEQSHQIFRPSPNYQEDTSDLEWNDRVKEAIHNPKYKTPELFQEKFGNTRLSSALTDVVITSNTTEAIMTKVCGVAMSGVSAIVSLFSGALGYKPTSILSHNDMHKEVHLFTNRGLQCLSYSLNDLEKRYGLLSDNSYPIDSIRDCYTIDSVPSAGFMMATAAQVTSAAPGYFPPVRYNDKIHMDGGMLQNNASIPCVLEAINRGHRREDLFVVSLGTGVEPRRARGADLGSTLTSLWFETTQPQVVEDFTLMGMLDTGACYRFQSHFVDQAPDLDDIRPATIPMLEEKGRELVEKNVDELREVCRVLNPECI